MGCGCVGVSIKGGYRWVGYVFVCIGDGELYIYIGRRLLSKTGVLCWWRGPNITGDGVAGGVGAGVAQISECRECLGVCGSVSWRGELLSSNSDWNSSGECVMRESLCTVGDDDEVVSGVDGDLTLAVTGLVLMCCGAHVGCKFRVRVRLNWNRFRRWSISFCLRFGTAG